ncbi:hypothetical protein MTR67_015129 [Solanum verrucosum]|uniref:C2H2-type domain-containing protein n=1 Tax=Solanum verrucosum TaxID=315347 RepID=A0AAF0TJU2_SOLVR|nr:zinc finger protein ZAT9-like [Solanum verrucosum]WMV21744.1 hypothetical protein MTR67_015129 [Solanum verrucosum]
MGYEDHEVLLKHVCKFCNKSFHCGRSLGGHMRSHMVNTTDGETTRKKLPALIVSNSTTNNNNNNVNLDIGTQNVNYVLRNNPKKTSKFSEDLVDTLLPKVCKECGKSFQSWKALFGHMKCHSSSSSQEEDSWNSVSESDTEATAAAAAAATATSNKKKRSSRKRYNMAPAATSSSLTVAANASSPCVSEIEHEQEEIAMSLIMLSRDVSNWVGHNNVTDQCSDNNSQFLTKSELIKKVKNGKTEQGESSKSPINGQKRNKSEPLIHGDDEKKKKIKVENENRVISDPKIKFECTTCNKSFHSYQALGGHRASHKNSKGETCTGTDIDHVKRIKNGNNNDSEFGENCGSKKQLKMHECPICYKIFPSGQALGGHKRSHLIAEAKKNINNNNNHNQTVEVQKPIPEIRNFLDLNLPAPVEEEDNILDSSTTEQHIEFQQWWIDSRHKHEQLLGLLSN